MSSSSTWAFTNFYPRPPRGGRPPSQDRRGTTQNFYPRPPRGGRLGCRWALSRASRFLSTPSARRATRRRPRQRPVGRISIHALREEGDRGFFALPRRGVYFYPRPPRGGRPAFMPGCCKARYFYPRPPRGGRPSTPTVVEPAPLFLSTPSARRATRAHDRGRSQGGISIHALREEGDEGLPGRPQV